jgi:hypothetical protein
VGVQIWFLSASPNDTIYPWRWRNGKAESANIDNTAAVMAPR